MATGGITAAIGDFLCQRMEISKCPSMTIYFNLLEQTLKEIKEGLLKSNESPHHYNYMRTFR
jgi:hypothetical protein